MTVAPDLAEPIIAWRSWLVVETPNGLRLHSTARAQVWPPGEPVTAVCRPPSRLVPWPRRAPHASPAESCSCGVYAATKLAGALAALDPYARLGWNVRHRIIGQVALWGRVIECASGWRAQHAYPTRLVIPSRRLHDVAVPDVEDMARALEAYGVPIDITPAGTRKDIAAALAAVAA